MKSYELDFYEPNDNVEMNVPKKLYHATYKVHQPSIEHFGLTRGNKSNWDDGTYYDNVYASAIYLIDDMDEAIDFAESADFVDKDIYDSGIIAFEVDTTKLDKTKFKQDPYIDDDATNSYAYYDNIPANCLKLVYNETKD